MKKKRVKGKNVSSKNVILIILLIVIAASIVNLNSQKARITDIEEGSQVVKQGSAPTDYIGDDQVVQQKSSLFPQAPELVGIAGYINTDSDISIQNLKGKVVLVDFWTYTCINCIRTLPYLKSWHDKYEDDGLVIVGVHTPEFEFEKDYNNVQDAVNKYDLKYPVVQDNNYVTWNAYRNRWWPHKYLVDIDGFVRYDHIGEGSYEETERIIQELLKEKMEREGNQKQLANVDGEVEGVDVDFGKVGTPEIYFGYGFTRGNFGNEEGLPANQIIEYEVPVLVKPNKAYLGGTWKVNGDDSELVSEEGLIILGYDAKVVNIVAGSDSEAEIEVLVDTLPLDEEKIGVDVEIVDGKSIVKIKEGRLYNLVDYQYGKGLLELRVKGKGLKINTFTFG
jgi:thiol-disulfide isomerase/thioredoxin